MDHMRHVDDFAAHHPELLDAWSAGCDARQLLAYSRGEVLPSPSGADPRAAFAPRPDLYRAVGITCRHRRIATTPTSDHNIEGALRAVKERGWQLWLFEPLVGALAAPALTSNRFATRMPG